MKHGVACRTLCFTINGTGVAGFTLALQMGAARPGRRRDREERGRDSEVRGQEQRGTGAETCVPADSHREAPNEIPMQWSAQLAGPNDPSVAS